MICNLCGTALESINNRAIVGFVFAGVIVCALCQEKIIAKFFGKEDEEFTEIKTWQHASAELKKALDEERETTMRKISEGNW